jgi:hypothetical protein
MALERNSRPEQFLEEKGWNSITFLRGRRIEHRRAGSAKVAMSADADDAIPIEQIEESVLLLAPKLRASKNSSGGKIVRLRVMFVEGVLHLGNSQH